MEERTFNKLVILYIFISLGSSVLNSQFLFWLINPEIIRTWNEYNSIVIDLRAMSWQFWIVALPLVLALLIYAYLGLLFKWRYSREVFVFTLFPVSIVVTLMVSTHLVHAWTLIIDSFVWFLAGVIVFASYTNPLKNRFVESKAVKNA